LVERGLDLNPETVVPGTEGVPFPNCGQANAASYPS
jgi:hypothetical protein